ncbi:MAG: M48 family metallopeptidase [Acidobacteriota bacterium]|nr:M48 family metallopeptidase [Acidobacteriota bacterium]
MKRLLIALAVLLLPAAFAVAQDAESAPDARPADVTAHLDTADGPVAVPEITARAMSYYRSGNWLWAFKHLWALIVPAIILFTGLSARIRDGARAIGRNWYFTIGVYFALYTLIIFVIELPLAYYQGFARPHAYDLSNQTFGKWFGDSFKELFLNIAAGFMFLWILYGLLRLSPKRWWLYVGLALIPVLLFIYLISPVWVDPLFHDYGPLEDKELEAKVLALAERAGVEGTDVYEVDLSVDTKALSAWVTGFLNTKRIVLTDNIIAAMTDEEVLFVVGHETAHYVLGHMPRIVIFLAVVFMAALWVVHLFSAGLIQRFKHRFGFDQLSDVASLPLILLLFSLASFVITPATMAFVRWHEREADRFALEITQTNSAGARAFVKLQHTNLGNPRPGMLYKLWRSSHPTLAERIEFCNDYRPWETGEPLVYAEYFTP